MSICVILHLQFKLLFMSPALVSYSANAAGMKVSGLSSLIKSQNCLFNHTRFKLAGRRRVCVCVCAGMSASEECFRDHFLNKESGLGLMASQTELEQTLVFITSKFTND